MRAIISKPTALFTNGLFFPSGLVKRTKEDDVVSSDDVVTSSADLICHNYSVKITRVNTVDGCLTLLVGRRYAPEFLPHQSSNLQLHELTDLLSIQLLRGKIRGEQTSVKIADPTQ